MKFSIRIFEKKECICLTWPAKILMLFFSLAIFYVLFTRFPLYLSKSNPVNGEFLVLDGQLPDYAIEQAITIFDQNKYKAIVVMGGRLPSGHYITGKKTMAEITYSTFIALDFDSTKLILIKGQQVLKDRTYTSGLYLKKWFEEQKIQTTKIDILSVGCHAKRSQYLFQKALGNNFEIGVVAIKDKGYNINKWWKTSNGVRSVISEVIALIYATVFFHP
ncbi:MAG: hypothetical protein AB7S72_07710 [Draconibacterium sp.]